MKNLFSYEGKRCVFAGCYSGMGEAAARVVESLGGSLDIDSIPGQGTRATLSLPAGIEEPGSKAQNP